MTVPIVVAGASGHGKSFLLRNVTSIEQVNIVPLKKLTTRSPRPGEGPHTIDLEFDKPEQVVRASEYRYQYGKHWYGLPKQRVEDALAAGKNPMVILRKAAAIGELLKDFQNAIVIYVQSAISESGIRDQMKADKRGENEIEDRMKRQRDDFHDYVRNIDLFQHVIINYHEPESLMAQMMHILLAHR